MAPEPRAIGRARLPSSPLGSHGLRREEDRPDVVRDLVEARLGRERVLVLDELPRFEVDRLRLAAVDARVVLERAVRLAVLRPADLLRPVLRPVVLLPPVVRALVLRPPALPLALRPLVLRPPALLPLALRLVVLLLLPLLPPVLLLLPLRLRARLLSPVLPSSGFRLTSLLKRLFLPS